MSRTQRITPDYVNKGAHKISIEMIKLISVFCKPIVKIALKKNKAVQTQPVFIVGAPRTGSTALYQALTNTFNVAYIDNLAAACFKNLPVGIWLSKKIFGFRPHNNFKADFGNTLNYGWHAPSECGNFWYRWLPLEDHFVDAGDTPEVSICEIRTEVEDAERIAGSPLLFKNLNAGQRLRMLSEAFPDARIIYIKRDPRFTAASIIRARQKNNIKPGQWWSIKPGNFRELLSLDEEAMAVAQVHYLEKQIEEDLGLFDRENICVVHYNELSEDRVISIGKWLGLPRKSDGAMPEFFRDQSGKMGEDQWHRLTRLTEAYPFPKDAFV